MSDGITIVLKGAAGAGRTVLAEKLKLLLTEAGFNKVDLVAASEVDTCNGNIFDQQLTIVESGG